MCVSGSVAAYKAIELARLMMRHGADVTCVLSAAAIRLIKPEYFRWATGNTPVTKLTGKLEHVELADYRRSDLIVVYPATANTIGKLAGGIDDTPVSTVLTVALGSHIPIIACMAMHESMHSNPAVRRNTEFLRRHVEFVAPTITEGKAKAPEPKDVMRRVLERFGGSSVLRAKKVLIVAGPTLERIDPVRSVISKSTGRTGALVASELIRAGADVRVVYGPGCAQLPSRVRVVNTVSAADMTRAVIRELRCKTDIVIMAAAVSDYAPTALRSKIKSGKSTVLVKLKPVPKIIDVIKRQRPDAFLIGFKAEARISRTGLVAAAKKTMARCRADMMVANDVESRARPKSRIYIIDDNSVIESGLQTPERHARLIRAELESRLKR